MELGLVLWGLVFVFGIVYFLSPLIIVGRLGEMISLNRKILEELRRMSAGAERGSASEKKSAAAPSGAERSSAVQTLNLKP